MTRANKPKEPIPETMPEQVAELQRIMRENRVDAWDLGFQGQLSPGDYQKGLETYITRFGFEQARSIVRSLSKVR